MDVSEVLFFSNADWFTSLINDRSMTGWGSWRYSFCDGRVNLVAILERRNLAMESVGWPNTHFEVLSVIFCTTD